MVSPEDNPYRPPAHEPGGGDENQLWQIVCRLWRVLGTEAQQFSRGGIVIFEGIAFYVKPEDATTLYAASPSQTCTKSRMNLVVAEVIRIVPIFLAEHPNLVPLLRDRQLIVRLQSQYAGPNLQILGEEVLGWDLLGQL